MKISKIPGLGRFGVFVDDVDLNTIGDEEWAEIGKLHLESLVTIIRNQPIATERYGELITKWGTPRYNFPLNCYLKYGKPLAELLRNRELDEEDRESYENIRRWPINKKYSILRVTPTKNAKGQSMGVFGDGELYWHSNECGNSWFTPGVALLGNQEMIGSSTGFLTTVDYYESLSESTRSELDEMIVIHNYRPGSINPTEIDHQENSFNYNFCLRPDSRMPLIMKSPGGIKGIHLGINTFDRIEGMTKEQSDAFFDKIRKELFVDENIYHHWYQSDNDLCLFDNSITLHNRTIKDNGTSPNRIGLRIQYDYEKIGGEYVPYYQDEFNQDRKRMVDLYQESIKV